MTLEEYFEKNYRSKIIDHKIRITVDENGRISFYIHADGHDSDTIDFHVFGNHLLRITHASEGES